MPEPKRIDWDTHFRRLENMYHGAPINRYFAPKLVVGKGEATVTIVMREDFWHAGGAVHGSVYFKMADDAAYFAANSLVRDSFVLTSTFHLTLLRPIRTGTVTARGHVVQNAAHLILADSVILDERGREVGRGTGSFAKGTLRLTSDLGYA